MEKVELTKLTWADVISIESVYHPDYHTAEDENYTREELDDMNARIIATFD